MTDTDQDFDMSPGEGLATATVPSGRRGPQLTDDPIGKLFAQLAIPASIGFLFGTLYSLVDTYWANQLGRIIGSSDPVDALGAGAGYFFFMLAVAIGLSQGTTSMITNALGRGDVAAARASFFQTIVLGLVTSLFLATFGAMIVGSVLESRFPDRPDMVALANDYLIPVYVCAFSFIFGFIANSALSAQGDFATLGVVQVVSFFLNCILDPLFMFGWGPVPAFGIMGLAVATVSINIIGLVIILYRTANSALFKDMGWNDIQWRFAGLKDLIVQCVPATANMAVIGTGYIVVSELINNFGSGAMGGFSNASRIEQLILLPVIGLQIAVLAIVGQNMGAKQFHRVRQTFKLGIGVSVVIMVVGMVLVWLFYDYINGVFAAGNDDIRQMGNLYLLYSSSALIAYGFVLISGGTLQGMKRPIMPLVINIVRLIIGPMIAFWIALTFFDAPNIHAAWIGFIFFAWGSAIFSMIYVWKVINSLGQ